MPMQDLITQGFTPPLRLTDFKLAAFDMDSTLITIECIDEIADAAGKKAEVAAITEAAMSGAGGEFTDFKHSLRSRLALLKGVPVSALEQVLRERLRFNPGARELCAALRRAGLKLVLVSGGFTFFTRHVAAELGMDYVRSNELEIDKDGNLTGGLVMQAWGEICDGEEKRRMLQQCCAEIGADASTQAIAVGDGANDLLMMDAAALSVAFHAKPKVRERAMVAINEGGLDRLLELFKE